MKPIDINQIKQYIPHRYPFLLVDRVVNITERSIEVIKNVSVNEPFFQGHYPQNPIMPGVLQIEALAQAGAILTYHKLMQKSYEIPKEFYFAAIDKIKFRKPVFPGDQLVLRVEIPRESISSRIISKGTAFVANQIVCEVGYMLTLLGPLVRTNDQH